MVPLFEIEPDNCTSEDAIMYLLKLEEHGCPLPSNVTKDVNPYCHSPEKLPRGIWFLVAKSSDKADIQNGFWKPSGPPIRVLLDPPVSGWRTVLEFFKGPDLQKTIWIIHEFNITRDGSKHDVNIKDSTVLCRILQSGELQKMPSTVGGIDFSSGRIISSSPKLLKNSGNRSEQGSTSAHQEIDNSAVVVVPNNPAEDDIDCISTGDYLELWDLSLPVSPSSSSENSSCMTRSSGEGFDSLALLRDLEQVNAPDVVLETATPSGVLMNNDGNGKSPDHESAMAAAASSSGLSLDPEGSKKGGGRTKKMKMKYLCFMPFMYR